MAFADIVGYTILMSTDGERTHARWMSLLNGTLRPLARAYGSTVVKSTGDGVVADFPTTADAFTWALQVQRVAKETDRPDLPPLTFRIAIDYGPLHRTGDDVYGVVANTAARLQEHAPAGGIALTRGAVDRLAGPSPLRALGPVALRSMPLAVEAFAWDPPEPVRTPRRPPLSGVPSIAIMPLEDLGGDPADLYFAAGIIDDIVNSLAALEQLSVVARSATVAWPAATCDPCLIGRHLGVRYALCGTLRRRSGGLRISVELRETEGGDRIWSDLIEAPERELFDVQDEIVRRIVAKLAPALHAAELRRALRRRPDSLTAYDLTLRGMFHLDSLDTESFPEAGHHFKRAMEQDPGYAMPAAWAGQWHSLAVGQGWSKDAEADGEQAGRLAHRAIHLDPANPLGYAIAGHHTAFHLRDPASALPYFDHALEACPNHALTWALRSASLSYLGRGPEAIESAKRGFELSPRGPARFYFHHFVGLAHYVAGEYADAVRWVTLSLRDNPAFSSSYRVLSASLVGLGETERARGAASRLIQVEPGFRLAHYKTRRAPFVPPDLLDGFVGHMRTAGVPD